MVRIAYYQNQKGKNNIFFSVFLKKRGNVIHGYVPEKPPSE